MLADFARRLGGGREHALEAPHHHPHDGRRHHLHFTAESPEARQRLINQMKDPSTRGGSGVQSSVSA